MINEKCGRSAQLGASLKAFQPGLSFSRLVYIYNNTEVKQICSQQYLQKR